ncbi:hypothetical protein JAAARDRAFT_155131 [Jaapia argillacea MUCL 33604]|uniref:Transcriptional repressor Tup1 N-terminal domain-containing protein n=1 Tax=Jaapia argillacea MUCL 33604 TaxID=933084 RepID=A0A067PUU1_9AGAM|nr:hypothetical protein JAAARDRAFT_155131 [Jaapia argillacea MUCL 33604]
MSSSIYNHRSLQPTGPPTQPLSQRLNESFDTIRQEFEGVAQENTLLRGQRDEFESKVSGQVNELNIIRQSLYDLEAQHSKIRQQCEEELQRLRGEILSLRQNLPSVSSGPPQPLPTVGPGAPPPPSLSAPPSSLQNPGPAYPDPYDARFRDREREREQRDRMVDRDRERERDRERDRDRDRDREREQRDPKRIKTDRIKTDRSEHFSPSLQAGPTNNKLSGPSAMVTTGGPSGHLPYPSSSSVSEPTAGPASNGFSFEDLDPLNIPPELKKEGSDWFAVFNPKVKRVLDVELIHTLTHESVVCCVRFSADGKYLATGCNHTAQIYDAKTGIKTCVLSDESADKQRDLYIRSVCFSPDGKFLATGAEDKQIRIWDIAKRKIRNIFDGHQQEIYSLDFSQDGRLIVSGSGDRTARIWDMVDGTSKILSINDGESDGSGSNANGNSNANGGNKPGAGNSSGANSTTPGVGGPNSVANPNATATDAGVTSVAISPNGQLVAAGSLDAIVRIWDVNTGQLLERLRGHQDSVYSVKFTPDGKGLVSGSLDKTLRYWDVRGIGSGGASGSGSLVKNGKGDKGGLCTMSFTGHKDYVLSVAVSHDANWVVSGSKDRGVQFWDARTASWQCMLQGHKNSVISIDLSPVGSLLATGSGDWQARIWSYNNI